VRRAAALLLLLAAASIALSACGGGRRAAAPAEPFDAELASARRAAAFAFAQGRHDQATQLYRQALERAQARDDGEAIGDLGYDLAVAQLRRGDAAAARATAQATRAELSRRGLPVFAELALVEASALYRLGDAGGAQEQARGLAADAGPAGARARFLLGLVAADRRDLPALEAALSSLAGASGPEWGADRAELAARAAALRGDPRSARRDFVAASDLRRDSLDYPGMARALAGAGAAAASAGDARDAADLFLRAGRSALLAGGQASMAEGWLAEAERLARGVGDRAILEQVAALRARGA
jgi:hypothetical protein